MKKIIIILLLCTLIIGCKKRTIEEYVVLNISENRYIYKVEPNITYLVPLKLSMNDHMDFDITEQPDKSVAIVLDNIRYLKWTPTKSGEFPIQISNRERTFSQTYILIIE